MPRLMERAAEWGAVVAAGAKASGNRLERNAGVPIRRRVGRECRDDREWRSSRSATERVGAAGWHRYRRYGASYAATSGAPIVGRGGGGVARQAVDSAVVRARWR